MLLKCVDDAMSRSDRTQVAFLSSGTVEGLLFESFRDYGDNHKDHRSHASLTQATITIGQPIARRCIAETGAPQTLESVLNAMPVAARYLQGVI